MGVPALFRWLTNKNSRLTGTVVEEHPRVINGVEMPVDTSQRNPNDIEFDNLYLDMNGIIHPCAHPEDRPAPETEDEMYVEIFRYIDRIFAMVRPRKVLFMAIDGVAPRAKMNQQRSRRFRAGQEAQAQAQAEETVRARLRAAGKDVPEKSKERFDSNCITPGTPFMDRLAKALHFYINQRLSEDPGWRTVKVILSDATVPGEGEHKIMDFIRRQREMPGYDPNTKHVLYGLDADLIMLALATHEPHFTILREDVFFNTAREVKCSICGQIGHTMQECRGTAKVKSGQFDEKRATMPVRKPFVWFYVYKLRETLLNELWVDRTPFPLDGERLLDDFVFLCFFVGNDFLPHLPSLEIRENAIDMLVDIYRRLLPNLGGYLTENGEVNLERMEQILVQVGTREGEIFRRRRAQEERRANRKRRSGGGNGGGGRSNDGRSNDSRSNDSFAGGLTDTVKQLENTPMVRSTSSPAKRLKAESGQAVPVTKSSNGATTPATSAADSKATSAANGATAVDADDTASAASAAAAAAAADDAPAAEGDEVIEEEIVAEEPVVADDAEEKGPDYDDVRLWEEGYRERYYRAKFDISASDREEIAKIVQSYVEGVCWVMKYYYQGVPSWKWFYPEHYAPFAADFVGISKMGPIKFEKGVPFKPFEQLMGVFPSSSSRHLPPAFRKLMCDPDSPIIDFYPINFESDLNGKKHMWQAVALLPFIDEERLLKALEPLYSTLTEEEKRMNSLGNDLIAVSDRNQPLFDDICAIYSAAAPREPVPIDPEHSDGLNGSVRPEPCAVMPGQMYPSPLGDLVADIVECRSMTAYYDMPKYPEGHVFVPRRLPGARDPPTHRHHPSGHRDRDIQQQWNQYRPQPYGMPGGHYAPPPHGYAPPPQHDPYGHYPPYDGRAPSAPPSYSLPPPQAVPYRAPYYPGDAGRGQPYYGGPAPYQGAPAPYPEAPQYYGGPPPQQAMPPYGGPPQPHYGAPHPSYYGPPDSAAPPPGGPYQMPPRPMQQPPRQPSRPLGSSLVPQAYRPLGSSLVPQPYRPIGTSLSQPSAAFQPIGRPLGGAADDRPRDPRRPQTAPAGAQPQPQRPMYRPAY